MVRKILISFCLSAVALVATAQNEPYRNPDLSPSERAWDLLKRMTLEEKISQMKNGSPAIERLGIPAYNWWNGALHGVARAGVATMFPQAIGLAATFDRELIQEIGDVVSTEGRAKFNEFSRRGDHGIYKGLTFWAPNVNIFRDPRWGRGHETYGEDPYLTGELGCAYIKGLQGPAVKILMLSSLCDAGTMEEVKSIGVKHLIPKPLEADVLLASLELVSKFA